MTNLAQHSPPGRAADEDGYRPRILFVDDDPNVLDGLRVALRRRLRRCELLFAPGALEALELVFDPFNRELRPMSMPLMGAASARRGH